MTPFDYVNSISHLKNDLSKDEKFEKEYIPFIVNRALSYFPDTIFLVNEMNIIPNIARKMQYQFLINIVRKRKRFAKWHKVDNVLINAIQQYYNVSRGKALAMLPLLSDEQKNNIKDYDGRGHLQ